MPIKIPGRLADKLSGKADLSAIVTLACDDFGKWMHGSHVPFFQDYTDHGADHVSAVLSACEWLIPNEAWDFVSPH